MIELFNKIARKYIFWRNQIFIAPGTYLSPHVKIGKRTRINQPSHIESCQIGRYCAIGGRLVVRNTDHYINYLNIQSWAQKNVIKSPVPVAGKSKGSVTIGNAVWIGDSVTVLSGVQIGDGAVIGACSVVTKPVPAYAVAVGNPARVIRMRYSPDIINLIKCLNWWDWSDKKIQANKVLFELDLENISAEELRQRIQKIA